MDRFVSCSFTIMMSGSGSEIRIWTDFFTGFHGIEDGTMKINNIVVACQCYPFPRDMKYYKDRPLCTHSQKSQFRPQDHFSAFQLSPYKPNKHAKAMIYGTGSIMIVGLFSPGEIRRIIPLIQAYLSKMNEGKLVTIHNLRVENIVPHVTGCPVRMAMICLTSPTTILTKVGAQIDLDRFARDNALYVKYNPKKFKGVIISKYKETKHKGSKVTKATVYESKYHPA